MTILQRFVTYIPDFADEVRCLTQEEFHAAKAVNDPEVASGAWEEWVWQMAASKQEAIRQHFTKMDEWHQNPDKEVY